MIAVNLAATTLEMQLDEAILEDGSHWLIIASNGTIDALTGQIQLRAAPLEAEPEPELEPEPEPKPVTPNSNANDTSEGCTQTRGSFPWVFGFLSLLLWRRPTPRHTNGVS
jgi:hypothetical protein